MKKLYILNVGSTYDELNEKHGDFDKWAKDIIADKIPTKTVKVKTEKFPKPNECLGVLVMGSHAMVSDEEDWMKQTADFLKECLKFEIPILGICFGHQLLAYTVGAKIGFNENGLELGVAKINLNQKGQEDKLFWGIEKSFAAYVSHFQSILFFPKSIEVLAFNDHEKIHAFRYGKNAYGVQFHPEFTKDIMQFYTKKHSKDLRDKYQSVYENIRHCEDSHKVLTNFITRVISKI